MEAPIVSLSWLYVAHVVYTETKPAEKMRSLLSFDNPTKLIERIKF